MATLKNFYIIKIWYVVDNDVLNWFPTLNNFYNGQHCPPTKIQIMMSWIDSRHWTISTGRHFQNGHHNTTKIQYCPISSQFDMWVDNDVPNWFPTLNNFYWSPFSKWPPQYRKNSTLSDIIKIWYVGRKWCPELIPDIEKFLPVAIFKMATTIPHKFNIARFQCHFTCG